MLDDRFIVQSYLKIDVIVSTEVEKILDPFSFLITYLNQEQIYQENVIIPLVRFAVSH